MMFLKRISLLCASGACGAAAFGADAPHDLRVGEGFSNPIGFHQASPTFSWKLPKGTLRQSAYQLEVRAGDDVWDSGWVESSESVLVPYPGRPFASRQKVAWRVRFRDEHKVESEWSPTAHFELGLLSGAEWRAQWIQPAAPTEPKDERVGWMRRGFKIESPITEARLHVTARGVFELHLNGKRVGQEVFANGWTSYQHRLDTLTYDVTSLLAAGENQLQATIATGWYAGRIGWQKTVGFYGKQPELLLQLEVTKADGSRETIVSDETWEGTWDGPLLSSSLYDGEHCDTRLEPSGWAPVSANKALGSAELAPKPFPPVRATQVLAARSVSEPTPGRFVFDLGQNMVGHPRVRVPMLRDGTLTLRFGEMLNPDGTPYTAAYRSAKCTDTVIAMADGVLAWEPRFTFHGFRYVEVSGVPAGSKPELSWVEGVVLHSDLRRTGLFESSHAKLNQLQSNITWGQRGNFLDIPTDCPQRDERLGWTGDAQVFCATSQFNYDTHAFWKAWLRSVRDDQFPDGRLPHVVPDVLGQGGSTGWMDAATIIPWDMYVRTGDLEFLSENLPMMERLIAWYRSQSTDGRILKTNAFGDWLQPHAKKTVGDTPAELLATAFHSHSARLAARTARTLGASVKARALDAEADFVAKAFSSHYIDGTGRLKNAPETQTAYLLALAFDLLPEGMRSQSAAHLVRLIGEADGHLRTGFLGTPYIVSELDRAGYTDLAYSLLLKETYPSWFYSINQGATTMWERWNSYSHDKGFGDVSMNSFNHYAYGAVGRWMYERVAGLQPDEQHPGYRRFIVRPLVRGPLEHARAELETPYGRAAVAWRKKAGSVLLEVTVPPGTTAVVEPPDGTAHREIEAGDHTFTYKLPDA